MKGHLAGPEWLNCVAELGHYQDEIDEMDDDQLVANSFRVEVTTPPSVDAYNDRDWRWYRRLIRQEMHRRGLVTPKEKPPHECW